MIDTVNVLVIHDYAYELKCEISIEAGDIIGDTTVGIESLNTLDATIYCYNSTIHIHLFEDLNNAQVYVYDLTGRVIYRNNLIQQNTEFDLKVNKGNYIIEIISNNKKFSQCVFVN